MTTLLVRDKVIIESDGSISLPQRLREANVLKAGDVLAIWWLPPDEIILRKIKPATDQESEFDQSMEEFRASLTAAGYDTEEKINALIHQIKEEQAQEWNTSTFPSD